jgi:hypothetical protein
MSQAAGQPDEWVFLFYVPYANDLWHAASRVFGSISSAFAKAARDAKRCRNARVLMQYKLRGDAHMRRRHWHCNAAVEWGDDDHVIHSHEAASGDADASCISSFRSFLSWASEHVAAAAHVGVVVMGHGGGVMQFCPEELAGGALRWMDVSAAAAELHNFNSVVSGRLALVFLQNCCKATLPALWPFRHLNCLLIASPTIIAAPNTYYTQLILHIFTCPHASPASAAAAVCNGEQPQDFAILSVFHSSHLQHFALALDALAAAAAPHMRQAGAARALFDSLRSFWVECGPHTFTQTICVTSCRYGHTNEHAQTATDCYVDVMAMCCALQTSIITAGAPAPHFLQQLRVQEDPSTKPKASNAAAGILRPAATAASRVASSRVLFRILWTLLILSSNRQPRA